MNQASGNEALPLGQRGRATGFGPLDSLLWQDRFELSTPEQVKDRVTKFT